MGSAGEALVLVLYTGGTIGMMHSSGGYVPYPTFITQALRTQSRFHDPLADSIFSHSSSVERYRVWSESRSPSGSTTPAGGGGGEAAAGKEALPRLNFSKLSTSSSSSPPLGPPAAPSARSSSISGSVGEEKASRPQSSGSYSHLYQEPFGPTVTVRSSAPKGTSTATASSFKEVDEGRTLELELPTLMTPAINGRRVRYAVLEYDPLLDSSEMGLDEWSRIAEDIALNYRSFDSFIVLHGTDTMAYTSSALSFMLEHLGKTVILTGAQIPLSELRNDAVENLLGALTIAGSYIIPEVTLYFNHCLFRGNRVSKTSNNSFDAFTTPNMPTPLVRVGIDIDVNWSLIRRSKELKAFRTHTRMCANVAALRLFPGLPTSTVRSFLAPPLQGLILESFGAGNAPSRPDLLEVFREASERGVIIVNISQCQRGEVKDIYESGRKLKGVGVVAGADMTPECALTKLAYLLGKPELDPSAVRDLMGASLRGELTSTGTIELPPLSSTLAPTSEAASANDLVTKVLRSAGVTPAPSLVVSSASPSSVAAESTKSVTAAIADSAEAVAAAAWEPSRAELVAAERTLLPYLIYLSASRNDVQILRTHIDALRSSAFDSASVARPILHDTSSPSTQSGATALPTVDLLDAMFPLHAAARFGHVEATQTLLSAGSSVHRRDALGHSPMYVAARHGHSGVVKLLREAGGHLRDDEVDLARWSLGREATGADASVWALAGVE